MADDSSNASEGAAGAGQDNRKMVPESDLIAAKKGLEKERDDWKSKAETAVKKADDNYQSFIKESTLRESIEKQLTEATTFKEKADGLEKELTGLKEGQVKVGEKLLTRTKGHITALYGVGEGKLDGKTVEQLETLEEALKMVGGKGRFESSDGSGTPPTTQFAKEYAEIEEAKQKK